MSGGRPPGPREDLRVFDYEECKRLHAAGKTVTELSEKYKVTRSSVRRALGLQSYLTPRTLGEWRSVTVSVKDLERDARAARRVPVLGPEDAPPSWYDRPKTRAECVDQPRPCPWVSCRWNLYLDVHARGSLQMNFPHLEPDQMTHSCALDVADAGGSTLEEVGEIMQVTRERIRQIQQKAIAHFTSKRLARDLGEAVQPAGFTMPDAPWHERTK